MPYADPEKQREAQARWYREKYQRDKKFQKAEASRKAGWLQTADGKTSNAAATARYRVRKLRQLKQKPKARTTPRTKARAKVKVKA